MTILDRYHATAAYPWLLSPSYPCAGCWGQPEREDPALPDLTAAAQNFVSQTRDSKHEYLTANCNCDTKINYWAVVCGRFLNLCQKCRQGLNNQLPLEGPGIETSALLAAWRSILPKRAGEGMSPGRSHVQQREKGSNSQTLVWIKH